MKKITLLCAITILMLTMQQPITVNATETNEVEKTSEQITEATIDNYYEEENTLYDINIELLNQVNEFYNTAWDKLIFFITILGTLIGIILPLYHEWSRKKQQEQKLEEYKKLLEEQLKEYREISAKELQNYKIMNDDITATKEELVEKNKDLEGKYVKLEEDYRIMKEEYNSFYKELEKENKVVLRKSLESIQGIDMDNEILNNTIDKLKEETTDDLVLSIKGKKISGNTVKTFYKNIIEFLIAEKINIDSKVPFGTGKIRYLINCENKHQNGVKFTAPIKVDKYFIETHKSYAGAINDIEKFLHALGVEYEEEIV